MKYEFVSRMKEEYSVARMCKLFEVRRNNFYRWIMQEERRKEREDAEIPLIKRIEEYFESSNRISGYRNIKRDLDEDEEYKDKKISEYKVRKVMKENGMYPVSVAKFKPYKKEKQTGKYYDNKLDCNFDVNAPNQVWAGDITYIKSKSGWRYLAVVMDLFNREIIGYAVSKRINTELAKAALANALMGKGSVKGVLFHSDRGSQYASKGFQKKLKENGMIGSMSKPGCPYDNACVESFFASLKKEWIYQRTYMDISDLRRDIFRYIELFYNRKRRHSKLGYVSPVRYRLEYEAGRIA